MKNVNGQLITFEFSLPSASSSNTDVNFCPNCGFRVHTNATSLITKESFSKTILILGCGTFLYFHYYRPEQLRAFLESIADKLQRCSATIIEYFSSSPPSPSSSRPKSLSTSHAKYSSLLNNSNNSTFAKHYDQEYSNNKPSGSHAHALPNQYPPIIDLSSRQQVNNCQVTNQIIYMDNSPPKTLENTVIKLDSLLDQVRELKESVQEFSLSDLTFERSSSYRLERRASENDLPSLEWDLEDLLQNDDVSTLNELSQVFQSPMLSWQNDDYNDIDNEQDAERPFIFNLNYNGIDAETLSKIVFNKNFDFKERICDRKSEGSNQIHESLAQIRQKLLRNQILYRTLRRNVPQVNALMEPPPYRLYKSCLRDSAYFED